MNDKRTTPNDATRAAEREEAQARHDADRAPTPDEDQAADALTLEDDVVEHEQEMTGRGARQTGEGRLP